MGKRLFVGSLPFDTTENALRELFAAVGAVDQAKLITDRTTGWSKGFGFVEMTNEADAKLAIEKLHNSKVGTRTIVVNEARPMEKREPGSSGPGRVEYEKGGYYDKGGFDRQPAGRGAKYDKDDGYGYGRGTKKY